MTYLSPNGVLLGVFVDLLFEAVVGQCLSAAEVPVCPCLLGVLLATFGKGLGDLKLDMSLSI
jgi:hypothetical protein